MGTKRGGGGAAARVPAEAASGTSASSAAAQARFAAILKERRLGFMANGRDRLEERFYPDSLPADYYGRWPGAAALDTANIQSAPLL